MFRKCNGPIIIVNSLLLIIILVILFYNSIKYNSIEPYIDNIFVSSTELFDIINNSGYFNKFTQKDMNIRNCSNIKECNELYKKNIIEFNNTQKNKLNNLIQKVNKILKDYRSLNNINWKFGFINTELEEGLPHTHINIIILSTDFFNNSEEQQINTLIHEKIHIYQKKYMNKTESLYKSYNFIKQHKNNSNLRRTNPDLNNYTYSYNGKSFYSNYKKNSNSLKDIEIILENNSNTENNSDNIVNINDFNKEPNKYEHPDEIFAYLLTEKIIDNDFNSNDTKLINYITN